MGYLDDIKVPTAKEEQDLFFDSYIKKTRGPMRQLKEKFRLSDKKFDKFESKTSVAFAFKLKIGEVREFEIYLENATIKSFYFYISYHTKDSYYDKSGNRQISHEGFYRRKKSIFGWSIKQLKDKDYEKLTGIWSGGWKPGFIKSGILRKKEEEEIPSSKETTKQEQEVQNIEENPTPEISTLQKTIQDKFDKPLDYKGAKIVTVKQTDGAEYTGEILNGKYNGLGVLKWASKVKGMNSGYPHADQYNGNWKNHRTHGKGIHYNLEKKETYEGEYIDGKYSSGIIFTADGKKIRVENNIRVGHKTDELKTSETETSTEKTNEEKLNELKLLYEKNLIDESEYKSKKQELIDKI